MLSKEEIETLIKSKFFRVYDVENEKRNVFFWYSEDGENHNNYCFEKEEHDILMKQYIDEYVEHIFDDYADELEPAINSQVALSLPSQDCRLKVLETYFKNKADALHQKMSDWEYAYLDDENILVNIKCAFYRNLDKFLKYNRDSKDISLHINTGHLEKGEEHSEVIYSIQKLFAVKQLRWLRLQIETEKKLILQDENKSEYLNADKQSEIAPKKIRWLGNASHLGNIIYQLAMKGFIEFPNHNGEINYTGLADRILNGFEFIGKQPTKKYLSEQINPDSDNNKISPTTKGKLRMDIADLADLS